MRLKKEKSRALFYDNPTGSGGAGPIRGVYNMIANGSVGDQKMVHAFAPAIFTFRLCKQRAQRVPSPSAARQS